MADDRSGLRERTRRAVQREIAEAASALFLERGYAATTIDEIAALAGMSARSVFRYFASKEEIILGKLDLVADEMLEDMRARPSDEPVWESLRRAFGLLNRHADAIGTPEAAGELQRVIFQTPSLFAAYLQRLQQVQGEVVVILVERAEAAGSPYAADDPVPRALVAAAFGCLVAAQNWWLAEGGKGKFSAVLDRAMAAVASTATAAPADGR